MVRHLSGSALVSVRLAFTSSMLFSGIPGPHKPQLRNLVSQWDSQLALCTIHAHHIQIASANSYLVTVPTVVPAKRHEPLLVRRHNAQALARDRRFRRDGRGHRPRERVQVERQRVRDPVRVVSASHDVPRVTDGDAGVARARVRGVAMRFGTRPLELETRFEAVRRVRLATTSKDFLPGKSDRPYFFQPYMATAPRLPPLAVARMRNTGALKPLLREGRSEYSDMLQACKSWHAVETVRFLTIGQTGHVGRQTHRPFQLGLPFGPINQGFWEFS